jgi:hypothetical protein
VWRIIIVLSIIGAGAYIGNESAAREYSHYFWDLTGYVIALDSEFPYRTTETFTFLYPPAAKDLFTLARTHLFELLSIAYVAAAALLLHAFWQMRVERRFEWLLAITAMGGMGVVSIQSGNVAILMNLTVLGLAIGAASGNQTYRRLLPLAIGVGALIKPQFALYLGLLAFVEPTLRSAATRLAIVALAIIAVHGFYVLARPFDWNEYTQGVVRQTMVKGDFGWGPAALATHFSNAPAAPYAGYIAGVVLAGASCFIAWRRSRPPVPRLATVSLAFVALTFANPRLPLYDLYAAGIACGIACGFAADGRRVAWTLMIAVAINLIPWTIGEFARDPPSWPWWAKDMLIGHLGGIVALLIALSRVGIATDADAVG